MINLEDDTTFMSAGSSAAVFETSPTNLIFTEPLRAYANLGSSCFVNASLLALFGLQRVKNFLTRFYQRQCISSVVVLRRGNEDFTIQNVYEDLLRTAQSLSGNHRETFDIATSDDRLAVTLQISLEATNQSLYPYLLTHRYYHPGRQEDAHEFLQNLFGESPELNGLFRLQELQILSCNNCTHTRSAGDYWANQLNLKLYHGENFDKLISTVQEALNSYFQRERTSDFKWKCNSCKSEEDPWMKRVIRTAPSCLYLTLGRWPRQDEYLKHNVYPDDQLVFHTENASLTYSLRGIVFHKGDSILNGHYTCNVKHEISRGNWWYYNNVFRKVIANGGTYKDDDKDTERTYILFYERN